jgi:hypothetical protein
MDGLALLCNLFADGPVTLKRLRLARVANLAELERTPPERLAEWLHASLPQARGFVEEARKLLRRLAEEAPPPPVSPAPRSRVAAPAEAPVFPSAGRARGGPPNDGPPDDAPPESPRLRPGLFPGLDETLCARLQRQQVTTVLALSERAGLALARRTGIPYSTLLTLARAARRFQAETARPALVSPPRAQDALAPALELRPFLAHPRRAPAESELTRSDEFTLPAVEPDSAGPFG